MAVRNMFSRLFYFNMAVNLLQGGFVIAQVVKVFQDMDTPGALRGLDVWMFGLITAFAAASLWYGVLTKSYETLPLLIALVLLYPIITVCIFVYWAKENSGVPLPEEERFQAWPPLALSAAILIIVTVSCLGLSAFFTLKLPSKVFFYYNVVLAIGMAAAFIPQTIKVFKRGSFGISTWFLFLTLATNITLSVGSALTKRWQFFTIVTSLAVIKSVMAGRIIHDDGPDPALWTGAALVVVLVSACVGIWKLDLKSPLHLYKAVPTND